jgi:hypothetical protein
MFGRPDTNNLIRAVAASALRLYYSIDRLASSDYTYWIAVVATCAISEIAAVLLCGCFPTLPRFYEWIRNERNQGSGYYQHSGYRQRSRYEISKPYSLDNVEQRRLVNDEEKHMKKFLYM